MFKFPIAEPFRITAVYNQLLWYGPHRGVDIASDLPDPVQILAPHEGHVRRGIHYQFGKFSEITKGDFRTILAHNKSIGGWIGDGVYVKKGQPIAVMGNTPGIPWSTGRHLHWQVYENGIVVDPLNYLDDTPMNMVTRVVNSAKKKFSEPSSVYIIVPGEGEYLVINNVKRKITTQTGGKDMEALKNIFGVFVSKEDASKIPMGKTYKKGELNMDEENKDVVEGTSEEVEAVEEATEEVAEEATEEVVE